MRPKRKSWQRFVTAFGVSGAAALALCMLLMLFADPLGIIGLGLMTKRGTAFNDARFYARQVIASGDFDSFLVGTSTIHSVDPVWAEEAFGGRFANLAIHGATPYELTQVMRLIGRETPQLRRVILGLDARRWCRDTPYALHNPKVVFPDWLYDRNKLNDFSSSFNLTMVEHAARQIGIALKVKAPDVPANGYRNRLIEANWNEERAKRMIHDGVQHWGAAADSWSDPDIHPARSGVLGAASFPDLALLQQAIGAISPDAELIMIIMPSHASALGGPDRATIEACKTAIAAMVTRPHLFLLDFRLATAWTSNDQNFWDRDHFRLSIAQALMPRAREGIALRRDAADGTYRFLAGYAEPPAPTALPASAAASPSPSLLR